MTREPGRPLVDDAGARLPRPGQRRHDPPRRRPRRSTTTAPGSCSRPGPSRSAVPPVEAAPALRPLRPRPGRGGEARRRPVWPWVAAVVLLVAVAVLASRLPRRWTSGTGGGRPSRSASSRHPHPAHRSRPASSGHEGPGARDGGLHHDVPRDGHPGRPRHLGDAHAGLPAGERRLRRLPRLLEDHRERDPEQRPGRPGRDDRHLRRRLREDRRQRRRATTSRCSWCRTARRT